MSYKIKSLLYFICFLAASVFYYYLDVENEPPPPTQSVEIPKENKDTILPEEHIKKPFETLEKT
ncbi:hypothetical protein [Arenibacter lacus]|uniref:hypothetical protein n=1 Tax=Arenibacter lacus TaxID=2608629 RepID=UPI00123CF977|nr:hypothetical protein [Arenibacter lacus]